MVCGSTSSPHGQAVVCDLVCLYGDLSFLVYLLRRVGVPSSLAGRPRIGRLPCLFPTLSFSLARCLCTAVACGRRICLLDWQTGEWWFKGWGMVFSRKRHIRMFTGS